MTLRTKEQVAAEREARAAENRAVVDAALAALDSEQAARVTADLTAVQDAIVDADSAAFQQVGYVLTQLANVRAFFQGEQTRLNPPAPPTPDAPAP